jgi:hypothetical protein
MCWECSKVKQQYCNIPRKLWEGVYAKYLWDKDIPTGQTLPNEARPIVRQSLGANPEFLVAQLALRCSAREHCATREAHLTMLKWIGDRQTDQ